MRVDLLAAAASPGQSQLLSLLIASKMSAGTITPDTQIVEAVAGPDAVAALLGEGAFGHLAAKAWFREHPLGRLDVVAPIEATGDKATTTVTFGFSSGSVVAASRTVVVKIAGRPIEIVWVTGETATQGAAKLVAAIASAAGDLPVTATNTAGVVDITSKLNGLLGNDITLEVAVSGGSVLATVVRGAAALAAGTGTCLIDNVLTLASGTEYAYIIPAANGNADAAEASATSSIGKLKTATDANDEGFNALLQQVVVGITGALAGAKTGTSQHNYGPMQYIFMRSGQSLPCELAAAEAGARAYAEAIDPAVNRINAPYKATLYPPTVLTTGKLTPAQVEDALQSGVTPVTYTSTGSPRPSRPITTYWKTASSGAADPRLLDTSRITGTYAVARDLRSAIPQEFDQVKFSADLVPGDDPPPAGVVEVRDVKGFVQSRVGGFWVSSGVVDRAAFLQAVADGTVLVRQNPSDSAQCDIVLPIKIVPPLAKFSFVVQHVGT